MRKVWIEVALNGPWSRALQPGIPDTVEAIIAEGIACAKAGAAIVHTHAYDAGGPQTFDWQVYARIIEGIRAKVDVPIYPSFPTSMIGADGLRDAAAKIESAAIEGDTGEARVLYEALENEMKNVLAALEKMQ